MRYIWSVIGFLFSGIAIYYFGRFVPDQFLNEIAQHWSILIAGAIVLIFSYIIRGYKTCLLLKATRKDIANIAGSLYVSIALNNILPFRSGDILRIFYLKNIVKIDVARSAAALIIERLVDLCMILLLFFVAIYMIDPTQISRFTHVIMQMVPHHILLNIGLSLLVLFFVMLCSRHVLCRIVLPALKQLDISFIRVTKLLLATCVQWLIEIVILSVVVSKFIVPAHELQAILSAFMCNLATLIPSAPGYVGTFEVVGIVPFQLSGAILIPAFALFVVMYHLTIWCFSTILGLLFSPFVFVKMRNDKKRNCVNNLKTDVFAI